MGKVAHTWNPNIQEAEKGSELESARIIIEKKKKEQTYKQFSFW